MPSLSHRQQVSLSVHRDRKLWRQARRRHRVAWPRGRRGLHGGLRGHRAVTCSCQALRIEGFRCSICGTGKNVPTRSRATRQRLYLHSCCSFPLYQRTSQKIPLHTWYKSGDQQVKRRPTVSIQTIPLVTSGKSLGFLWYIDTKFSLFLWNRFKFVQKKHNFKPPTIANTLI